MTSNPAIQGPDLLSLGASMLIVVAAVIAFGWLYSRLRFNGSRRGDLINVVASRALGPKERLLVVEVDGTTLLVGLTATQVQTLHTFDKPVAAALPTTDTPGFADRLRMAMRGAGK